MKSMTKTTTTKHDAPGAGHVRKRIMRKRKDRSAAGADPGPVPTLTVRTVAAPAMRTG